MRHLVKKYSNFKPKVLAQFKSEKNSFDIINNDKCLSLLINGHNIADLSKFKDNLKSASHLISDIISKGIDSKLINIFISKEAKDLSSILDLLKDSKELSVHISEMYKDVPVRSDISEIIDVEKICKKLRYFVGSLHDVNETLKVCHEDASALTSGKLINSMWGAKPMQKILLSLNNEIVNNCDWERIEFYVNMINKSVEKLLYKMHTDLNSVCLEEQKIVNTVLIPNIIDNYYKVKNIISGAVSLLSKLIYIDELFKKNTTYPASWFINNNMLEDLRLDYINLISFMLKIPIFEKEIIHPLDIIKHNFMKKL
jgi:hypothetical protein